MKVTIDSRQFKAALRAYKETTRKSMKEITDQRTFNIVARTVDSMLPKPGAEASTRSKIKSYLNAPLATRIKLVGNAGELASFYKRRGSKKNQLQRVHLILQARRRKAGLKGLYGQEMRDQSARFSQAAQVGVGFLKSAFLPIIKGLLPFVKFRRVATRWGRISVWPGSDGYGRVTPAKVGPNPFTEFRLSWRVAGTPTKVNRLILPKLQAAFDAEARELMAHTQRKLQAEADKIRGR